MKKKHISIKWRIFQYLIGFSFLLLVILWLFQTVFLDSFYKRIKLHETEKIALEYAKFVQASDWDSFYEHIVRQGDVFVEIFKFEQSEKFALLSFYKFFFSCHDSTSFH